MISGFLVDYDVKQDFYRVVLPEDINKVVASFRMNVPCLRVILGYLPNPDNVNMFAICEANDSLHILTLELFEVIVKSGKVDYIPFYSRTSVQGSFSNCSSMLQEGIVVCLVTPEVGKPDSEPNTPRAYSLINLDHSPLRVLYPPKTVNFRIFEELYSTAKNESISDFRLSLIPGAISRRLLFWKISTKDQKKSLVAFEGESLVTMYRSSQSQLVAEILDLIDSEVHSTDEPIMCET